MTRTGTRTKKVGLLIIDAQRGFCDGTLNNGKGELYVPGAERGVERLAEFVRKKGKYLYDIDETLDCHHKLHIGHGLYWTDPKGERPPPFTTITEDSVKAGQWRARLPSLRGYDLHYVSTLQQGGRYPLTIWPEHCLIGTAGNQIMPLLSEALLEWEDREVALVGKHSKGSCPHTEHYGAVAAEVPYPNDPTTRTNMDLVRKLQEFDQILVAGWASSHCVANTVRDVAAAFGNADHVKKFVLLTDCTDPVPGCEAMAADFIKEFTAKGMQTALSTDVL